MTTVYVSRQPTRARFESVQFGNAAHHDETVPGGDFLSPLVPIPNEYPPLLAGTNSERYGSVAGLTMAYKRRSK